MEGCDVCNAKQRMRVSYGRKMLCGECFNEYRMMFEGIVSNKTRRRIKHAEEHPNDNPLFNAFKRGWETEEREKGLDHVPIPQWMEDHYQRLYKHQSALWEEKSSEINDDTRFYQEDLEGSRRRYEERNRKMIEEQRKIDGISENT